MKKLIILALVFVICTILSGCAKKNVVTSSNLIDAVEIDELYGSEFVYNGVTQIPVERNNYNIKYNSTVKVGINTSDLSFDIDEENDIIKVIIPEVDILDVSIDVDSIEYLPSKPNLEIKTVLKRCEEDAIADAKAETYLSDAKNANSSQHSSLLFDIAEDNICSLIKGLISPLIEDSEYTVDFYRTKTTHTTEVIR